MKICIFGTRTFNNYNYLKLILDEILKNQFQVIVVSGNAKGTDKLGEKYANENNLDLEVYPANWNKYGKSAGMIRNKQMAEIADYFVCFWDGNSKGTQNMINLVKKLNKPLKIFKYKERRN